MRRFVYLLVFGFVMLVGPAPIGAEEGAPPSEDRSGAVDCLNPEFLSNALIECDGAAAVGSVDAGTTDPNGDEVEAAGAETSSVSTASDALVLPPYCRVKVDAVFWGGRQWLELAQGLAKDHSQCAEYYVSIPPLDAVRTTFMVRARFDEVRATSPRIHPVAEIRFTGSTGWRAWVVGPHPNWAPGRTFYGAGVEVRRRMAQRGLDVTAGETWALNELSEDILENVPGRRDEIREFLRGMYDGAPGMPKARGIVFNIGPFSDDRDLATYKASLQEWLTDEPFWQDMDAYVDFFAHEVYANPSNWGVAGLPLARRAQHLNDYFFHMSSLAEAGPATVEAARQFLRRAYVPLTNAAWPHPGIGATDRVSAETMSQFVSTQVYAIRHYANAHPTTSPQGKIGFGWAPNTSSPRYSTDGRNMLLARLASAIHESSEEGTNSQMGACGPPGEHIWCAGDVDGASLNDAWKEFDAWG